MCKYESKVKKQTQVISRVCFFDFKGGIDYNEIDKLITI